MDFRFKDILKNILPGLLLLIVFIVSIVLSVGYEYFVVHYLTPWKNYQQIILIVLLAFAYMLGYLIDGLASYAEYYIIYKYFGTPTLFLLRGKRHRYYLANFQNVLNNLTINYNLNNDDVNLNGSHMLNVKKAFKLFKQANQLRNKCESKERNERAEEFYLSYVFARNFLCAYTIAIIIIVSDFHKQLSLWMYCTFFVLELILFARRRAKSYYYSREVLSISSFQKYV